MKKKLSRAYSQSHTLRQTIKTNSLTANVYIVHSVFDCAFVILDQCSRFFWSLIWFIYALSSFCFIAFFLSVRKISFLFFLHIFFFFSYPIRPIQIHSAFSKPFFRSHFSALFCVFMELIFLSYGPMHRALCTHNNWEIFSKYEI